MFWIFIDDLYKHEAVGIICKRYNEIGRVMKRYLTFLTII